MKPYFLSFLIVCLSLISIGQPPYALYSGTKLDSVKLAVQQLDDSEEKAYLLQELAFNLTQKNTVEAMAMARQSQVLAKRLQHSVLSTEAHKSIGLIYLNAGNLPLALNEYMQYRDEADFYGNLKQQASSRATLANLYVKMGRKKDLQNALKEALNFAQQSGDSFTLGQVYRTHGTVIRDSGESTIALDFHLKALEHYRAGPSLLYMALTQTSIGNYYSSMLQYDKAEEYLQAAFDLHQQLNNSIGLGKVTLSLANISYRKGHAKLANAQLEKATQYLAPKSNPRSLAMVYFLQTEMYLDDNEVENAHDKAKLAKNLINLYPTERWASNILLQFSSLFERYGHLETALHFAQLNRQGENKRQGKVIGQQIYQIEQNWLNQAKNEEIIEVNQAKKIAEVRMEREREQKNQLLAFSCVVLILVFILVLAYFRIRKVNGLLGEKNTIIAKDLEVRKNLLHELHHRVTNNLQIVDSFFFLQERKVRDQTAKSAIKEGRNRLRSMSILHQELYRDNDPGMVQVHDYLTNLIQHLKSSFLKDRPNIALSIDFDPTVGDADFAVNLGLIINELLTNAFKYAFPGNQAGNIAVSLKQLDGATVLAVKDNGVGLPDEPGKAPTSGLTLVRNFSHKLGGKLSFDTRSGTEISLRVPKTP